MKNKILKAITGITFVIFCASACALDSEQLLPPLAVMGVSFTWLMLFAAANGGFKEA